MLSASSHVVCNYTWAHSVNSVKELAFYIVNCRFMIYTNIWCVGLLSLHRLSTDWQGQVAGFVAIVIYLYPMGNGCVTVLSERRKLQLTHTTDKGITFTNISITTFWPYLLWWTLFSLNANGQFNMSWND